MRFERIKEEKRDSKINKLIDEFITNDDFKTEYRIEKYEPLFENIIEREHNLEGLRNSTK